MYPPSWSRAKRASALAGLALLALVGLASSAELDSRPADAGFHQGEWPFKPAVRPALPEVSDAKWAKNPIDNFILRELETNGLKPSPPADKLTLLRRVTFDLTGLPPTVAELDAFLADDSPDAYEKVVDRLLASPRFGERWAQYWLDLVRYAETDGFKVDGYRPNAHRYRDYVIKAFNDDLPYDRFIQQQLAGDELEPDNPDALIATGLNRLYPDETNAANVNQRRQEILNDITEVTGLTFMGLTIGCAQCHDHKFDPILQKDFFRLQAFFASMEPSDDIPAATPKKRDAYEAQLEAWEQATKGIRDRMDALVSDERAAIFKEVADAYDPETRQAVELDEEERDPLQEQLYMIAKQYLDRRLNKAYKRLTGEELTQYKALQKKLAEFDPLKPAPLPMAMAIVDAGRKAPPTFRLASGTFGKPLEEVQPGFPMFLGASEPNIRPPADAADTTGRRSALALWLSRKDHPLTSRVMVNRLWAHHFGVGIVGTPNDFGVMGEGPSHPELLDWLAVELTDNDWRLKAIHRLIVTSATYRQSSRVDPADANNVEARKADPNNKLLWHMRRRRVEGDSIRDSMLLISGQLNMRMYGQSACPQLPPEIYNDSRYSWEPDANVADQNRRSVYVFACRNLRYPILEAFDQPDLLNSCPKRTTTITAPQSSLMMNSELTLKAARQWAGRLLIHHLDDEAAMIRMAYTEAFARQPTKDEVSAGQRFIARQSAVFNAKGMTIPGESLPDPMPREDDPEHSAAVVDFCHSLLNSNEALFVD